MKLNAHSKAQLACDSLASAAVTVLLPFTAKDRQPRVLVMAEALLAFPPDAVTSGLAHWLTSLAKKHGIRSIGLMLHHEEVKRGKDVEREMAVGDDESKDAFQTRLHGLTLRLVLDVVGGRSAGRLMNLLCPWGKPTELPGAVMIWRQLSVEGFYEDHPHGLPKIGPVLRELIDGIGPEGVRRPTVAIYPIDQIKEAVAHAVQGGKCLLRLSDVAPN